MDTSGEAGFSAWAAVQGPRLHRFAYLLCGDWHDAEDLVQDALAKAALHWKRIERLEYPDAYVRTILVNRFRSAQRRPWRRALASDEADLVSPDATEAVSTRMDLVEALRRLPVRQRATVILRYYEGLSEAETAAALGCSVGTVKSQHHRAMRALQLTMAKEGQPC